jgi:ATP-dependent Lon protease
MRGNHPVLSLRELVLLPGMVVRHHAIRLPETASIEAALSGGPPLVAVPQVDPAEENADVAEVSTVGCLVEIQRVVRLGDGTLRVLLEGKSRVHIQDLHGVEDGGLRAHIRPFVDLSQDARNIELMAGRLREGLRALIQADPQNPPALARLAELDAPPARLVDQVAANLTIPHDRRVAYLTEASVDRRVSTALVDVAAELQLQAITGRVQKEVQTRLDKQQRDYFLREQIARLRKELGDSPDVGDDAADLEKKLREANMPAAALDEALKELERLRRMHPDAAEYHVSRTWLEWLAAMPWTTVTPDNTDLAHAQATLDADHFGLGKVKDRILEYLAVRTLKPDGRGPVLCLVGPPGVGKTSLGRSIAKALGRQFQRVSLGGMKDEAEIRGHRRTYVGALPGRLIAALKRAGSRNPVIILDEIDKLGKDFRGDPASALLEVLDPEQHHEFMDHYLDTPFDLSQVLFICTANDRDPIPSALRDRLEIVEIAGYIQEEKARIAQDHLIPRARAAHGLPEGFLTVTPRGVDELIEKYTREAGVRRLEQRIAALHRKAARRLVGGEDAPLTVDSASDLKALLGPQRHFPELAERADLPGISIGLAWTETGGEILFIEVTRYAAPGEGLKLTGQLGSVMKESAEAALTVLRSRAASLGIDPAAFKDTTIHVHIPAGAIPKDGPSAGIALVTALASLFTGRLVRPALAMTGELTLRGKVLPVGGIKEKVLAARRAGVTDILLPHHNEGDLDDVPASLRAELRFHFVDRVDQVFDLALGDALPA